MMLGGSKSKLTKHGENWENIISGLFVSEGVGSTVSLEITSFVKSKYNQVVLLEAHLIQCFLQLRDTT